MPTSRRSRVFTISMPPEMAKEAQLIAKKQSRSMSELMREAFRVYRNDEISRLLEETAAYAATRNPNKYSEEDVERLVHEVRGEKRTQKEAQKNKARK